MDPGLVACIEEALNYTVPQYQKMRARKYAYTAEIHRFFNDWDFLLTPLRDGVGFARFNG